MSNISILAIIILTAMAVNYWLRKREIPVAKRGLDKFRNTHLEIEPHEDDEDNYNELEDDVSETYKVAWKCTNCKHEEPVYIERGTRVEDADIECPKCGCY